MNEVYTPPKEINVKVWSRKTHTRQLKNNISLLMLFVTLEHRYWVKSCIMYRTYKGATQGCNLKIKCSLPKRTLK